MREIGDNNVYALLVECALMRLTLFTEYDVEGSTAEYTDVVFTGLLAHSLDPVMSGNILSDIEPNAIDDLVKEESTRFKRTARSYGWPPHYETPKQYKAFLHDSGYTVYDICSSYGMSGWVIAKAMALQPRASKYEAQ